MPDRADVVVEGGGAVGQHRFHLAGRAGPTMCYSCRGVALQHVADRGMTLGGMAVNRAVEREVLRAVEPTATKAALAALASVEGQHEARRAALELARQQAQYEAHRARRQYDAVEPEKRLVTAELERRWNEALEAVARALLALAEDLETLLAGGAADDEDLAVLWCDSGLTNDGMGTLRLRVPGVPSYRDGDPGYERRRSRWSTSRLMFTKGAGAKLPRKER